MIRMVQSISAAHAKAYFSDALSKSDYYVSDQELEGKIHGKLAKRLGLDGIATKEIFYALCENRVPGRDENLTPITKEERTVGYDINFHCPKSVSIIHALSADDHILPAFRHAVDETMRDIERDSQTRVRKDGAYHNRKTGELIWAEFVHQTARPVNQQLPDVHLHAHAFCFNATFDFIEERRKAGQFRGIKRDMPYYQARFHKRLADALEGLGYEIELTKTAFEIKGVPKELIRHFSKRTDEIGRFAKKHGITDAKQLDALGARTRGKKMKSISMAELRKVWKDDIKRLSAELNIDDRPIRHAMSKEGKPKIKAADCVEHTLRHEFERASVMPLRRLHATAVRQATGIADLSISQVETALEDRSDLLTLQHGEEQLMTRADVLVEEKDMVRLARQGIGEMHPLYNHVPPLEVKDDQAKALAHLLTTSNRVSIVRGAAGTGKSTLLKEARTHIEAKEKSITVLAPSVQASREELRQAGFANAETVAHFLSDKQMQETIRDQVLWVDEAGLLGTRDMLSLLSITEQKNARLILGGDTRQHSSVVRGDALRILNTVGGIRAAEVSKIYRQKDARYRAAVDDLSRGAIVDGFVKLDALGSIKKLEREEPYQHLVNDYMKALKTKKKVLAIAPTHREGDALTSELRKALRAARKLGKRETAVPKYINLNFTEAQKRDSRNYQPGYIVQFNQNIKGAGRGSQWRVKQIKGERVVLVDGADQILSLARELANKFDVFETTEILLSAGDKIRLTSPGFDQHRKRLSNGMMMTVTAVNRQGDIQVQNELSKARYTLPRNFAHIDHAHVITSYAAQGKTVDEVFIAQSAESFGATDAKQFYVSASRGKHAVHLYTDDKENLLMRVQELGDRQSALEVLKRGKENIHAKHVEHNRLVNGVDKEPAKHTKRHIAPLIERDHYEP